MTGRASWRHIGHRVGALERLREQPGQRRDRAGLRQLSPTTPSRPTAARRPAIGGYLAGDQVVLTGVGNEYYGPGADPTVLANLQGQGTLAIAGGGNVVAGPERGRDGRADGGNRGVRIDRAGPGRRQLRSPSCPRARRGRRSATPAAPVDGGPVRRVGADRRGAVGGRLRGRRGRLQASRSSTLVWGHRRRRRPAVATMSQPVLSGASPGGAVAGARASIRISTAMAYGSLDGGSRGPGVRPAWCRSPTATSCISWASRWVPQLSRGGAPIVAGQNGPRTLIGWEEYGGRR